MNGPVQVQHLRRRAVRFMFRFNKKLPEPDLNQTPATLGQKEQSLILLSFLELSRG
jgi:hypothetical protein